MLKQFCNARLRKHDRLLASHFLKFTTQVRKNSEVFVLNDHDLLWWFPEFRTLECSKQRFAFGDGYAVQFSQKFNIIVIARCQKRLRSQFPLAPDDLVLLVR